MIRQILLLLGAAFLLCAVASAEPPSAGWNFGTDTYAQHTGSLILNSLSDRYGIATFDTPTQHLGTNDYIEENGVKNTLAMDGYTKAYDYNPNSTTGYGYNSVYNQPLPNVPLTKLTFMGLDGDPTKAQNVYVLTSEYNTLSDQGQAASIGALQTGLGTTNSNVYALDQSLAQTNTQVNTNTAEIGSLYTGLNNETGARVAGDQVLQSQINATNSSLSGMADKVNQMDQVKIIADMNVRIRDAKKYSIALFDMYDGRRQQNFAYGVRLTYKMGKSYEETVLEKQQQKIAELESMISRLQETH